MNNQLLIYPIGSMEQEDSILETLKTLISREAYHMWLTYSDDCEVINIYIRAYKLRKEGRC